MVCVFDFNGYVTPGHFPVAQWADYENGRVVFGGDWQEIPDWIVDHEPTEQEVLDYVKAVGGRVV